MSATPIYDRHRSNHIMDAEMSSTSAPMQETPPPTRPVSLQVPAPAPTASRWSRTTYSSSIYEEDSFNDDNTTAVAASPEGVRSWSSFRAYIQSHGGIDAPLQSNAGSTAHGQSSKRSCKRFMKNRFVWILLGLLCLLGLVAYFAYYGVQNSKHKTSGTKEINEVSAQVPVPTIAGASATNTSTSIEGEASSLSSPIAEIRVATQILTTTVGTLTMSAGFGSTSL